MVITVCDRCGEEIERCDKYEPNYKISGPDRYLLRGKANSFGMVRDIHLCINCTKELNKIIHTWMDNKE